MLVGVGNASAVFAWAEEEEEGKPGEIAVSNFFAVIPWVEVSKSWITLTGRGRTLVGGEPSF